MTTSRARAGLSKLATLALTLGALATGVGLAAPAQAASPFERGPAPTQASINAVTGPFATTSKVIFGFGRFGNATVYYPRAAPQGRYGVVAIAPGFLSPWAIMQWIGPRLASQGFVVIGMDTNTPIDQPAQRAEQLKAALDAVAKDSKLATIADSSRQAVAGWSMGGGGALDAAVSGNYKAVVALAPWEQTNSFAKVTEPTLVIGGEGDTIAPEAKHAEPFYEAVNAEKAYLEINDGGHLFPGRANDTQASAMISWLKRWVDDDTRYSQFICPGPAATGTVNEYRSSCPM